MHYSNNFVRYTLLVLVPLVSLIFIKDPGTKDLSNFIQWAHNADNHGIVEGFKLNSERYPPLASVILLGALRFFRLFGIGDFDAIKLSIFLILLLTSVIFWFWTRDILATVILYLSLILNSVALGYIDVYFIPSLILSFWALKERKLVLFTIFFSIACLTKWQPIIIFPFIAIYLLNIRKVEEWKKIDIKRLLKNVLFPGIVITILTLSVYGVPAIYNALHNALNENFLSGNALNFNWIITHFLHVIHPEQYGGLIKGQANFIGTDFPPAIAFGSKFLFTIFYVVTCIAFFKCDKSFEELMIFMLIGYFSYFMLSISVHENHLILAVILSIILFWLNRNHLYLTITLILITNVNMFLFYGYRAEKIYGDSGALGFSRVIGNVDIALLFSLFNVVFFLILWGANIFSRKMTNISKSARISNNSVEP